MGWTQLTRYYSHDSDIGIKWEMITMMTMMTTTMTVTDDDEDDGHHDDDIFTEHKFHNTFGCGYNAVNFLQKILTLACSMLITFS